MLKRVPILSDTELELRAAIHHCLQSSVGDGTSSKEYVSFDFSG